MARDGRKLSEGAKSKKLLKEPAPVVGSKRLTKREDKSQLSFSFRFFRQIPFFQLGEQDGNWYLSLLERLRDLSGKDSSILADVTAKKQYRLHPINWGQTNIPIHKDDLNWIPKAYRDSEDVEFQQFEITQSNGRVVGFFNETNEIFYIVLLDSKHNIQPTRATGYRVDMTYEGLTDYQGLLIQLKNSTVVQKHIERADQMVWIEEDLLQLFYEYGANINDDLEEFLENKYISSQP